ncbi:MAG: ABC transporter permease subunit [Helicobacter sp.]|nr:ABC transporter permease subunit [Helicobacter sp.]
MRPALFGLVVACILALIFGSVGMLFYTALNGYFERSALDSLFWSEVWIIFYTSVFQAFLSAAISVIVGFLCARALFYARFPFKSLLLALCGISFVMPSLIIALSIILVFNGINIYGLFGILLAHVFLNAPFCLRIFYQNLQGISNNERNLAQSLGIINFSFIKIVELKRLKLDILRCFGIVFMLCFSSFGIVLLLGGGIGFSTFEVAIYQNIFYLELEKASILSLLQIGFYVILGLLLSKSTASFSFDFKDSKYHTYQSAPVVIYQYVLLFAFLIFLLLPFLFIFIKGLFGLLGNLSFLLDPDFLRALFYSIVIATFSSFFAILASFIILLHTRVARFYKGIFANVDNVISAIILGVSPLTLGFGLFLWLRDLGDYKLLAVSLINALFALPFCLKTLQTPLQNCMNAHYLCQSLGLSGSRRFLLIEFSAIKTPLLYALGLCFCLSLGDFSAMALFGDSDFSSLTLLLYQKLGNYKNNDANVLSLILMLLTMSIFMLTRRGK